VETHLYVGAGGGGDGLAALLLHHALGRDGRRAAVASYSWDRFVLDPAPGPRTWTDFDGLVARGPHCWEVTRDSRLRRGGTSTLALLAQHTTARYFLLDPHQGALGISQQLEEIIGTTEAADVTLVDVGGDVIARGDEPTLRSPLADSLALAAVSRIGSARDVFIAGAGLDGELPADLVRGRCDQLGITKTVRISAAQVADNLSALQYHPSEATGLLAAAASGVVGQAEIRDNGSLVLVAPSSRDAVAVRVDAALSENRLAQQLVDTRTLTEAEATTIEVCGKSELAYERTKAASASRRSAIMPELNEARGRLREYIKRASARGATITTFRRVADVLNLRRYDPLLVRELVGELAHPALPILHLDRVAQWQDVAVAGSAGNNL